MTVLKNVKTGTIFSLLIALLLTACSSPQKLLESGNYDDTIHLCVQKLRGKKKKTPKYVVALEEAFEKATQQDMREIERLKRDGRAENWTRINDLYKKIARRQLKIQPLLPLVDKEGYQAEFAFVRVDDLERESREKAAEYRYTNAKKMLEQARNGDKIAARDAYDELGKIDAYFQNYRDTDRLMNVAHQLGTTHILFGMENASNSVLPRDFEREIKSVSVAEFNTFWKQYYLHPDPNVNFDYRVTMNINRIDVSPETIREREYMDHKEIEDGWEYILDDNGNVMKDSLGNDIKVPRKIIVKAFVLETFQHKVATVQGRLDYVDLRTNQPIRSEPIAVDAVFENYASTFRGDRRALSPDSRRCIGNSPRPFPSDADLILTAAEQMKPVIRQKMARNI